tara:strand:- start:603 stop:1400 length:798 start_codon:yes stop_codon:yes gene_type:complete
MAIWNKVLQKLNNNNTEQYEVVMLADKDGNILNSSGAASNIPIAAGEVGGYSHINKFGYSNNISSLSTIWDGSNIYTYSSSAGTVTVAGSSDDDSAVIEIQGLDANYNVVVQDVTLDGEGDGTASTNLIRIFRARVKTPASGETSNAANLSIRIAGQERAKMLAGNGQTLMAVYTVPAGKTAYLLNLSLSVDKNVDVIYKLFARPIDDGGFNLKGQFGTFGTPFNHSYPVPLRFEEKTDIEIQADAGNNSGGGATFDLILVDNPV